VIDSKRVSQKATRWLSWYGVGLVSADRLLVLVRIPAGPLGSLKCDPPKGNGRGPQKSKRVSQTKLPQRCGEAAGVGKNFNGKKFVGSLFKALG